MATMLYPNKIKHPQAFACGCCCIKLQILGSGDLDAGAHSGSDGAGTDILTLCSCGLSLNNSSDQSVHVLQQLLSTEGNLADGAVEATVQERIY